MYDAGTGYGAPPDGTFHVDCDEGSILEVDADIADAAEPSPGKCFEAPPDGTLQDNYDEGPNLEPDVDDVEAVVDVAAGWAIPRYVGPAESGPS